MPCTRVYGRDEILKIHSMSPHTYEAAAAAAVKVFPRTMESRLMGPATNRAVSYTSISVNLWKLYTQ